MQPTACAVGRSGELPPPPSPAEHRPPPEPPTGIDWPALGRIVLVVVGACAIGVGAGFAAGWATFGTLLARTDGAYDDWDEFGAAIWGVLIGFLSAVAGFLVTMVLGVHRTVPRGRRLRTACTIVASMAISMAAVGQIGTATGQEGLRLLASAGALVAAIALVGAVAGAAAWRVSSTIALLAIATMLSAGAVAWAREPMLRDAARADRYARTGAPLALFDGSTAAPPVDGWTLVDVDDGWSTDDVTITFDDGSGGYPSWVELHLTRAPRIRSCEQAAASSPCIRLGQRADGAVIWGEPARWGRTARGPADTVEAAWVDVPGGRWALDGTNVPQPIDAQAALEVLASLEPVDAATFTAAT